MVELSENRIDLVSHPCREKYKWQDATYDILDLTAHAELISACHR